MSAKPVKLEEMWLVQAYQHGCLDACETATSFSTEAEALGFAKENAAEVPYTRDTEHEYVVFKAIATYRGRLTPVRHSLAETPE